MNGPAYRFARGLAMAALVFAIAGGSARAGQLVPDLKNESTLAGYDTTFAATVQNNTTGSLTVTILNTTPLSTGGALTAFAFNLPSIVSVITLDTSSFTDNNTYTNVNTPGQFGTFDYGLSTGNGSWQGGTVAEGVAAQQTGTFTFNLTGSFSGVSGVQLTNLFLSSFSTGGGNNTPSIFAARFQGLPGSDTQVSTGVVPEPSTMALCGLAGAGILLARRFRRGRTA